MSLEFVVAGILLISLTFYALMGGADFGAGVWSLLACGPRAKAQRDVIDSAIGPIWEANHVWLILVIVLLFTAFPPAFALISITLHIPLTLMLIGIVLRGSAFAFRTNDVTLRGEADRSRVFWQRVFGLSSVLTPVFLALPSERLLRAPSRRTLAGSGRCLSGRGSLCFPFPSVCWH